MIPLLLSVLTVAALAGEPTPEQSQARLDIGKLAAEVSAPYGKPVELPGFSYKSASKTVYDPCGIGGDLSCARTEDASEYYFTPDDPDTVAGALAALNARVAAIEKLAGLCWRYSRAYPDDPLPDVASPKAAPDEALRRYKAHVEQKLAKAGVREAISQVTGWEPWDKRKIGAALARAASSFRDSYDTVVVDSLKRWGAIDVIEQRKREARVRDLQGILCGSFGGATGCSGSVSPALLQTINRSTPGGDTVKIDAY